MIGAALPALPALIALAAGISPAAAADVSVHGSENFRLRFWQIEGLPYGGEGWTFVDCPGEALLSEYCAGAPDRMLSYQEAVERLNLVIGAGAWRLTLQGDAVALFSNRYVLDGELFHERDLYAEGVRSPFADALVVPEKVAVDGAVGPLALTLGDGYTAFGRGIALNLVKNTDVDLDTSLRGVKGVVNTGPWEITALSAVTNPQQVAMENPNEDVLPDDGHAIQALRVARYGLGPATLAAHGVVVQYRPEEDRGELRRALSAYGEAPGAVVAGGSAEFYQGAWSAYAEGDGFIYDEEALGAPSGYAAYASVSRYQGAVSLLLEAKRTKDTERINAPLGSYGYEIASGPTMEYERAITEDSAATINSNDLWGALLRADIAGADGVTGYASVAGFRDHDTAGLHFNTTPETIAHPLGGFQIVRGRFDARLNAGFRLDVRDAGGAASAGREGLDADRVIHADGEVTLPLGDHWGVSLSASALQFAWGHNEPQQGDFLETANALALHMGEPFALILYGESSSNPLITTSGNLGEDLYGAAEFQWKPAPSATLKAFVGAYRAGIHCAGGQCRYLPGFKGAKLSFDMTF